MSMQENKIIKYTGKELQKINNAIEITNRLLSNKVELIQTKNYVIIGNQKWAHKNLEVSCFRNGDIIPEVKSFKEWMNLDKAKQPAWCYYDDNESNGIKNGKLYNWYAVDDKRGLAPAGWHIPSDEEWSVLINYLGGDAFAGKKMKDISGFFGLPSGFRNLFGQFKALGAQGRWWSSTENKDHFNDLEAFFYALSFEEELFPKNHESVYRESYHKVQGYSVRCIKE